MEKTITSPLDEKLKKDIEIVAGDLAENLLALSKLVAKLVVGDVENDIPARLISEVLISQLPAMIMHEVAFKNHADKAESKEYFRQPFLREKMQMVGAYTGRVDSAAVALISHSTMSAFGYQFNKQKVDETTHLGSVYRFCEHVPLLTLQAAHERLKP